MAESVDSMCAVYAELVDHELSKSDPDMDTVGRLLGYIKAHCGVVPFKKGEVPGHLEDHLFESGSTEEGTVVVDGRPMPRSAHDRLDE